MNAILALAGREIREGVRNRWIIGATLALTLLAVTLAFLGSAPAGAIKAPPLAVTVVSLSSLSIFLLPLIALMLSFDGIAGEAERGTLLLLLSYPASRGQIVAGKFLGYAAIVAIAVTVGYGSAGVAVALLQGGVQGSTAYFALIGSSIMLGTAFAALGILISAAVRERAMAAGISVAVWLIFVLLFDMALLGALAADTNQTISPTVLPYLLMLNPTDVYRFFNLTFIEDVRTFAGMTGVGGAVRLQPALLAAVMAAWIVVPLALAALVFKRTAVR